MIDFNPIIGLILTAISEDYLNAIVEFQSHYRSDFNWNNMHPNMLRIISIPL